MGLYDREYAQADSASAPPRAPTTMVTKIIVVTAALYLVDNLLLANYLTGLFHLNADIFTRPWTAWRLVTYGLAHAPMASNTGIFHVLFNMYSLWLFGRAVEQKLGSREFLALYLALIALAGVVWALICNLDGWPANEMPYAIGASGAVVGMVVLFAMNFPKQKFILFPIPIPMPAWILGILLVLMDVRGAMSSPGAQVAYTAHLGGAAFAALYQLSGIRLTDWSQGWRMPKVVKPRIRIYDQPVAYEDLDRRADAILQKVHREGADSITTEERSILDDYSRRMRRKHS